MTITQEKVLQVLFDHKKEWLNAQKIMILSGIHNRNHLVSALTYFLKNDYIYAPNMAGEICISPEGEDAYINH